MPQGVESLLAGRNRTPLNGDQITRAANTFLGLDDKVPTRYEEGARTIFVVRRNEREEQYGEIVFGMDIYPGTSSVDPNSSLSLKAAAAHELTHYYRWRDMTELNGSENTHLDEALTSLEAIARYAKHLNEIEVRQLVSDAIQRINLHLQGYVSGS